MVLTNQDEEIASCKNDKSRIYHILKEEVIERESSHMSRIFARQVGVYDDEQYNPETREWTEERYERRTTLCNNGFRPYGGFQDDIIEFVTEEEVDEKDRFCRTCENVLESNNE